MYQEIVSTVNDNYDFMQSRYNMNEQVSYNKMRCHIKNKQETYIVHKKF